MEKLTQGQLEDLLQTHQPKVLLDLYADLLDQAGKDFLEAEQKAEADAANQMQAWSDTFRKSLPPVPGKPWEGKTVSHQPRVRREWLMVAAALFLFFVPMVLWRQLGQETPDVMRDSDLTATVAEKRDHLASAWLRMAETLVEERQQPNQEGQAIALTMAAHYLKLALATDPNLIKNPVVGERLLPAVRELFPEDVFRKITRFDHAASPPEIPAFQSHAPHENIDWGKPTMVQPTKNLHRAYLELADSLMMQAQGKRERSDAIIDYQWAEVYLSMARHLNLAPAEVYIRLIRIKENLGETDEANSLDELLKQQLN